jgi:5-hydroxyisourate hydrolase
VTLSTHVLDTARGVPAAGIALTLYALVEGTRTLIARDVTNADGRTDAPLATTLDAGVYELVFAVAAYFEHAGTPAFFDDIPIRFLVRADRERYHVPLLLAPWGYSTYRGS